VNDFEGVRLDLDGGRSPAPTVVTPSYADAPALASNGDTFLLAYEDEGTSPVRVVSIPLAASSSYSLTCPSTTS